MNYIARIKENQEVTLHTEDYFDKYPDLVIGWQIQELSEQEVIFIQNCKLPKYIDGIFVEAYIEVIQVPQQVHNHKLRLALIHFEIMPSAIDMAIDAMTDLTMREKIYTLWNFAPILERADTSLNYMATQFEISQQNLDQIFIYANTLQ